MHVVVDVAAGMAAVGSLARSLPRLLLTVLAVQTARRAQAATADGEPEWLRAYRLAVLCELLGTLRDRGPRPGGGPGTTRS